MVHREAELSAMRRALALAADTPSTLPNPRVGCVILDQQQRVVGEGAHQGAGTSHAEVAALQAAGPAAGGATAVVTLEPCRHTGRTGPCTQALIRAGVRRVVFAQPDPNPEAGGGAAELVAAGIEVEQGLLQADAIALNHAWSTAVRRQRPFVTWKFAAGLDGRSAARDGTSQWITSAAARRDVQRLRRLCDTMLVGTNTAELDDPRLTVRAEDGVLAPVQPLRAVMGRRVLDPGLRVFDPSVPGSAVQLRTHRPDEALAELWSADRRHVLLEGGPTLAAAFLRAGLVDEVVGYLAPVLLGAGSAVVGDLGIDTIADALRLRVTDITVLPGDEDEHPNVRITMGGTP